MICRLSHTRFQFSLLLTQSTSVRPAATRLYQTPQLTTSASWLALIPATGVIFVHSHAGPVLLMAGHTKARGLLYSRRGVKQGSNYNGMRGRGIVRGRTDAERQEKTISLIQLINIINVIIFLLWFKHSVQKSCLLVRVSDKSLQTQKARCSML